MPISPFFRGLRRPFSPKFVTIRQKPTGSGQTTPPPDPRPGADGPGARFVVYPGFSLSVYQNLPAATSAKMASGGPAGEENNETAAFTDKEPIILYRFPIKFSVLPLFIPGEFVYNVPRKPKQQIRVILE